MHPDKLEEVSAELESEMAELRERAPQIASRPDKIELGWLARRGRRLYLAMEDRRSGPVLVVSIWAETAFGEAFPIRDAQFEITAEKLPVFSSIVAKAIRLVRDRVGERLAHDDMRRAGGDR